MGEADGVLRLLQEFRAAQQPAQFRSARAEVWGRLLDDENVCLCCVGEDVMTQPAFHPDLPGVYVELGRLQEYQNKVGMFASAISYTCPVTEKQCKQWTFTEDEELGRLCAAVRERLQQRESTPPPQRSTPQRKTRAAQQRQSKPSARPYHCCATRGEQVCGGLQFGPRGKCAKCNTEEFCAKRLERRNYAVDAVKETAPGLNTLCAAAEQVQNAEQAAEQVQDAEQAAEQVQDAEQAAAEQVQDAEPRAPDAEQVQDEPGPDAFQRAFGTVVGGDGTVDGGDFGLGQEQTAADQVRSRPDLIGSSDEDPELMALTIVTMHNKLKSRDQQLNEVKDELEAKLECHRESASNRLKFEKMQSERSEVQEARSALAPNIQSMKSQIFNEEQRVREAQERVAELKRTHEQMVNEDKAKEHKEQELSDNMALVEQKMGQELRPEEEEATRTQLEQTAAQLRAVAAAMARVKDAVGEGA